MTERSEVVSSETETVAPAKRREEHIPGEPGLWVLLFGDMVIFAVFFGMILVLRGQHPDVWADSQPHLTIALGTLNTIILLSSSLAVVNGVRLARLRDPGAPTMFWIAIACGVGFIAVKAVEYTHLLVNDHSPAGNDFFTYYFVFTGIHLGHVLIGIGGLVVATRLARRENLGKHRMPWVEGVACFWHLVDLLWIVLFALLYLVHA